MSRALPFFLSALFLPATTSGQDAGWLRLIHGKLGRIEQQIYKDREELAALGVGILSQTTDELGYQHRQVPEPPPEQPSVQIDLGTPQEIDWIVLVPALVDWQQGETKPYAFPPRFRVDASNDPNFTRFKPVALFTSKDYRSEGFSPTIIRGGGIRGRYVRLTVTKLAEESGTHSFALSEIMVIRGVHNIALSGTVTASNTVEIPPRVQLKNINDGRSPLGPPIIKDLLPYDGLYSDVPGIITVDLGQERKIDEVRLHPVHARLGADVPGFSFPSRFVVEIADEPYFTSSTVLMDASSAEYPNPGNNPVVIPLAESKRGRYLRVRMLSTPTRRCGLSEIEIFSGEENVARGANVTSTEDTGNGADTRPRSLITDGYASYGRLLPLPEWLERWERRNELRDHIRELTEAHTYHLKVAQQKAWFTGGALALLLPGAGIAIAVSERRKRVRSLHQLRNRIAQDLHDEIGSNIAGIAIISDTAPAQHEERQKEDWQEINRIARETSESMREVLWVVGARAEAGPDFSALLRRTAGRLLSGIAVDWIALPEGFPETWPGEARRQVFLIFKEALANISRHSGATHVTLSVECGTDTLRMEIHDNGRGFAPRIPTGGMGINGMKERARNLNGRLELASTPGSGTRLVLLAPLQSTNFPPISH
jgi:signal transduction histidine kinase